MFLLFALLLLFATPTPAGQIILVQSAAAGGTAATDWTPSAIGVWLFEEASAGDTALVEDATSCGPLGADCDLTDNNTVGRDTTNYVEGTKSADFVSASSHYFSCVDNNPGCDELDVAGDISIGCWVRDADDAADWVITKKSGDTGGYKLLRGSSNDQIRCQITDGTDTVTTSSAADAWPVDTWVHAGCTHDSAGTSVQMYANGATSGSAGTQQAMTASGATFNISASGTAPTGEYDECFVIDDTLTAAEWCRICSCQWSGILCMCDASTPANYKSCSTDTDCRVGGNTTALCNGGTCVGRNSTETPNCGSCTLPDCNAAAP